jgi:hypothetical protein
MIQFNMGLPDSVVDWPGFFTTNKDHVKAVYGLITMANGRPGDVTRDVFTRDTHFDADPPNQPNYFTFNGKNYEVDGSVKPPHADGSDLGSLWATSESVAYEVGHMGDPLHMITLRFEAYAINETGKILNLHDFTTDSLNDPFGLLKTIAVEGIISGVDFNGAQVFNRGNIDLIVIPDLVVAIAQKYGVSMASSISTSGN